MKIRKRHIIYLLSGLLYILIALTVVGTYFFFNPAQSSWFLKCYFHELTGYDCPGCGTQRMFHHLLHGEFLEAFLMNPYMVVVVIPTVFVFILTYFLPKDRFQLLHKITICIPTIVIMFIMTFTWWIVRNTDWWHEFMTETYNRLSNF